MAIYQGDNGYRYKAVSRWLPIRFIPVTKRHSLYDYSEDGILDAFKHNGKMYALGQFMRLTLPVLYEDEDGKLGVISGYDNADYWNPYFIEVHPDGECVRLYEEIHEEDN